MHGKRAVFATILAIGLSSFALAKDGDDPAAVIRDIVVALDESDLSASEIGRITSFPRIDIVDLGDLEDLPDFALVEKALSGMDDGWAMVQTAIVANEALREELLRRSVSIRRIEAMTVDSENGLTVYIR